MTVDMSHSCCRLVRFLAPLLSKQEQQINWVLDTGKRMAKVGIMIMGSDESVAMSRVEQTTPGLPLCGSMWSLLTTSRIQRQRGS